MRLQSNQLAKLPTELLRDGSTTQHELVNKYSIGTGRIRTIRIYFSSNFIITIFFN